MVWKPENKLLNLERMKHIFQTPPNSTFRVKLYAATYIPLLFFFCIELFLMPMIGQPHSTGSGVATLSAGFLASAFVAFFALRFVLDRSNPEHIFNTASNGQQRESKHPLNSNNISAPESRTYDEDLVRKAEHLAAGRIDWHVIASVLEKNDALPLLTEEEIHTDDPLQVAIAKIKYQLQVVTLQACAIARDQLQHPVFTQQIVGEVGRVFGELTNHMRIVHNKAEKLAQGGFDENGAVDLQKKDADGLKANLNLIHHQYDVLLQRANKIASGRFETEQIEEVLKTGDDAIEAATISSKAGGQLDAAFDRVESQLRLLTLQARKLATDELDSPLFDHAIEGELGEAIHSHAKNLKIAAARMNALADGDLTGEWRTNENETPVPEETDEATRTERVLSSSIQRTTDNFKKVLDEIVSLIESAKQGNLFLRANTDAYSGYFKDVCEHLNALLEAVETPLEEIGMVFTRLSMNDLTARVEGEFHGTFALLQQALNSTIENFQTNIANISSNAQNLAASAEEFSVISQNLAQNASNTAEQSTMVSSASDQISRNIESVVASTSEMSTSIREIAANAHKASDVVHNAQTQAKHANQTIHRLSDSSKNVEHVIKIISEIAAQTRLLALNATIESARAGEAGKGFAVVANEVKQLADATANATGSISERIEQIQNDTADSITVIDDIGVIIDQITAISNNIAAAVEEQSATTNEIKRTIDESGSGVQEITQNITVVSQTAHNTSHGADETRATSQELSKMAVALQDLVEQFSY
ncbi:MAG: methyl-accepting chemotaxis protein [Calditrichaeota bacterium]|nr:MAG: methyl-accepting chemotaxis protein [Calditrichota bacterium]